MDYFMISFNEYGEMLLAAVYGGEIVYPIEKAVECVHDAIVMLNTPGLTKAERAHILHMKHHQEELLADIFKLRNEIEKLYAEGKFFIFG